MATEIIAASISVDTGNSNANVSELNKNTSSLKTNLKETGAVAEKTGKDVDGSTGSFGKLKDKMSALPGPLGQAGEGINKVSTAFKALLANPVVLVLTAIVAVLALMYKSFTNTFEGGQKVEQVFAGIKAVGQSLIDSLEKIGSAIVKVFSFDFSGAIDDIKGVAKAAGDAYSKVAELTKQAQGLAKEQRQNDLDAVDRQAKIADLKEKISSGELSPAERKKAAEELKKESAQNAKDDLELARQTAENKIALLTVQKDGEKKNADEINQIKIEQRKGEIENAGELRSINKLITAADKAEAAGRKSIADQAEATRKERAAQSLAAQKEEAANLKAFNDQLQAVRSGNELSEIKDSYERQLKELEQKNIKERNIILQGIADKTLTIEQSRQLEKELDKKFYAEILAVEETRTADKKAKAEKEAADLLLIEKNRIEAAQKQADRLAKEQFERQMKGGQAIINDPMSSFKAKQDALNMEVAANQAALDAKIISEGKYNENVKSFSDARIEMNKAELQSKLEFAGKVGDALGTLADLAGRQSRIGKGLAIAQASITAIQGAINSYTSLSSIPIVGPALGAIAAAGAIAAGIANIKKIKAVQVPGGDGGGGSMPSITAPAAPIAPIQQSTDINQKSIAGVGDATSGRTYLLSDDITKDANRNTRLNRAARLG